MHQIKRSSGVIGGGRKGIGMHLASKTGLTDRVRGHFRLQFKASNQLLREHPLDISIIMVYEASVPQGEVKGESGEVKSVL